MVYFGVVVVIFMVLCILKVNELDSRIKQLESKNNVEIPLDKIS